MVGLHKLFVRDDGLHGRPAGLGLQQQSQYDDIGTWRV